MVIPRFTESEIVVGSTFEVTSATDLKLITLGYGAAAATGLDNNNALAADKTYVVTTPLDPDALNDNDEEEYGTGGTLAAAMLADTSDVFRGDNSDGVAIITGDMEAGDVLVVTTEIATTDMDATIELKEVLTGDTAFVAGQTYEIATMGSSQGTDADRNCSAK